MSIWNRLKHFNKNEEWGEPARMNVGLLLMLDSARSFLQSPFIVTCGTSGDHVENSLHYKGQAVDIVIVSKKHPFDLLVTLERWQFGGIGYYPHWKYQGKTYGGWHLDNRTVDKHSPGARWMGVLDENGEQKYVGLSYKNWVKYGVIGETR